MNQPSPKQATPVLITAHCAIFLVGYVNFVMSLGRTDFVEELTTRGGPVFIPVMLALLSLTCVGYFGMWAMRRWGVVVVAAGGVLLNIAFAILVHTFNPFLLVPLVAAVTTAPMWPVMKDGL